MKILLTGPRGNLGEALRVAGPQHEWIELGRDQWPELPIRAQGVQAVVHAASDLLTPLWKDPRAVMDSNLHATVRLLEVVPKTARFFFVSSCAVYGRSEVTREETEPVPISVNGIAKFLNEAVIAEFCTHHAIDYQIARVFNTFGERDRFSILNHLRRALQNDQPFTMFNQGISQRDFIHVHDAATLIVQLLERPVRHRVINLGSGEATRIRDIVEAVRAKFPQLKIAHQTRIEAEYSRAEISRLREVVGDYRFRGVLDFIRQEF